MADKIIHPKEGHFKLLPVRESLLKVSFLINLIFLKFSDLKNVNIK